MSPPTDAEGSRRLFVALEPSDDAVAALAEAQQALRRELPDGVRWVRPEAAHLTLRFLGEVPEAKLELARGALTRAASGPTLELRTGGLGAFPSPRRASVLWLGVEGELGRLEELERAVAARFEGLGSAAPPARFRPHLTLGRVRRGPGPTREALGAALRLPPPAPAAWPVRELLLVQSELRPDGPRYTTLARGPLGG